MVELGGMIYPKQPTTFEPVGKSELCRRGCQGPHWKDPAIQHETRKCTGIRDCENKEQDEFV